MATDIEQYWEQEYLEFESVWCHNKTFWRSPAHLLIGTPLFSLFERFCDAFSDHPDDHNTVFYLFESSTPSHRIYSILFHCSNFEHGSSNDLRALTEFLDFAAGIISTGQDSGWRVQLLDGCGEKLIVTFYELRDEIVSILQQRCSRRSALPEEHR
jgi:hypothetical protein